MSHESDDKHLDWLEDKLSGYESELSRAEATARRLTPLVSNLAATIAALRVESRGDIPSSPLFDLDAPSLSDASENGNSIASATSFVPGAKKSSRMPDRKREYASVSIMNAAGQVINGSDTSLHANDVAREIYIINTDEEFKAAKQNVASDLLRGSKKGFWIALGRNQYVKNNT